ncbi:CpsD/CapB family tyrosine-protein kinase [Sphingomonas hankyongi]|uniref:CpsD/CapB family tyrosine-protein kinase n=1 Tax=Sphingomonas hankyongi TaxID=2908209 RepID=A0ABT0S2L7_9SPHN|nr:CpsD/CapB family tyrosine-protein kinase [Sphingomonas hankyongi]MCL6730110.1 CpsD/CapB family tyrosine-protein kinase [Sphingomonas hankyongi]
MATQKGALVTVSGNEERDVAGTVAGNQGDDWRRNSRNIVPKGDHLLEHGIYALHHKDPRAKPFLLLRSQVLNALGHLKGSVLAVTSASALNGKSHVAANLACAISRVRETRLVDLHLRRPVIGDRFGLPQVEGISSYLEGSNDLGQLSFRIQDEQLAIHAAGRPTEDSSDLLLSPRLGKLMSKWQDGPDEPICIVDTPPVLENDDMLLISKQVDGILFVVEEGRTTRHEMMESFRLLNGTPVIGTILNKSIAPLAALHG